MKVWYRLPNIDSYLLNNWKSGSPVGHLIRYFKDDLSPMYDWLIANAIHPYPEFKWQKNHVHDWMEVAVAFVMDEEFAPLFVLKFGTGEENVVF